MFVRKTSLLLLIPLLLQACGERVPEVKLAALPDLDLTAAEASVREQLTREHQAVEDKLARGETGPEMAAAFADLGLLYVTYEFLGAAEVCFANARTLDAGDFRHPYLLGYLKMIRGQLDEAAVLYEETLELEDGFVTAILRLGRTRLDLAAYDAASRSFERALELDPQAAAAHEGLGRIAAAAGDDEAAIGHFERALELDPDATALHYALAQSHRNLGRLDAARAYLEKSGDVATRVPDPLINPLANLAESVQFYLVQGAEAMDDERYEAASASWRAALERDATSFTAYRGLAISLERLGDLEGAIATFEEALEKGTTGDFERDAGERARVLRSLGSLAALGGREPQALDYYLRSLELVPEQPDTLLRAANALARGRRFDDAVAHYDRLIALEPQWTAAVLEKRATALVNLGRKDEAIADFRRAVEAAPEDARLRLRFAAALDFLGDEAGAAAERRAAETIDTDDATRATLLAEAAQDLARQGDFAAAIERFREALALAPDDGEIRYTLASLFGHVGRFDDAVAEFERLIAVSPRHEGARRGQIVALIFSERYGEARVKLRDAVRQFPRDVEMALLYVRLLATAPDAAVRDGALAFEIAQRVHNERREPPVRQALALAAAAAGRFDEAVELQRVLVGEAERAGEERVAETWRARLTAFERREAWAARSAEEIVAGP